MAVTKIYTVVQNYNADGYNDVTIISYYMTELAAQQGLSKLIDTHIVRATDHLPTDSPERETIAESIRNRTVSLVGHDPEDGEYWYNVPMYEVSYVWASH